jgi:hypothetical protein
MHRDRAYARRTACYPRLDARSAAQPARHHRCGLQHRRATIHVYDGVESACHLAGYLRLANDQRIKTRRNPTQMAHSFLVAVLIRLSRPASP